MGFLKWLFGKKKIEEPEYVEEEQTLVYERDNIDFHDEVERGRYLVNCMEQIGEAEKELDLLRGEYNLVTSYLTDMEEIEALPSEEASQLKTAARRIVTLEEDVQAFFEKKSRMSDSDYRRIQGQEEEIEEGIAKIKEAEKYRKLVQQDLNRLDGERGAYQYRKTELNTIMANMKGMATIWFTALLACMIMLAVLQFGFGLDTAIGFFLSVGVAAVAITVLYVKYMDAQNEMTRVEKASNKLILLQNKVKIRYVNNVQLLDYLYMKYQVENGTKLEKLWEIYKQEKEDRRQFAQLEVKLEQCQEQMLKILRRYQLKDPDRWIHQAAAIIDNREMIEIRHGLIVRRQSLRSQIDYNQKVAETASSEVREIATLYPQYQDEIADLIERYERNN
ncbi:MAG: hypothetical protein IJ282_07840 [Lachnospiraceae bacterium]|nr:hypothetical protein [Lachnospiraceae bacterium]